MTIARHWLAVIAVALALIGLGCASPNRGVAADRQQRIGPGQVTPAEIQSVVMSFADQYFSRIVPVVDELQGAAADPAVRVFTQEIKTEAIRNTLLIASSANPVAALIDMTALVTLQRMAAEQLAPRVWSEQSDLLISALREMEAEAWSQIESVLEPPEILELRAQIEDAFDETQGAFLASRFRLSAVAAERGQQFARTRGGGNLLTLFQLDPLAGMSPASREILQSRLLAERAFFFLSRLPQILNWEIENVYLEALALPETRDALNSVERVGAASERIAILIDELDEVIAKERTAALDQAAKHLSQEREATVAQLLEGVRAEREAMFEELREDNAELRGALVELQTTLKAGTELSASLEQTIGAADDLVRRFRPEDGPERRPFDILEYQATIESAAVAAERFEHVSSSLNQLLESPAWDARQTQFAQAKEDAEGSLERLVDRAFQRGLVLIIAALIGALITMLAYRLLTRRFAR